MFQSGPMAERLGKGLQNPVQRFNSASDLICSPVSLSWIGYNERAAEKSFAAVAEWYTQRT